MFGYNAFAVVAFADPRVRVTTIGTSTAAAVVTGAAKAQAKTAGTSAGTTSVSGAGKAKAKVTGSSTGTTSTSGIGKAKAKATGASAGSANVNGVAKSGAKTVGTAVGSTSGSFGTATIRLWGGHGKITLNGKDYQGIGDRAIAQQTANALGGAAQGYQLGISGVEPAALALLDSGEVKGASVVIYRLIFDSTGRRLLDQAIFDRGRVDALQSDTIIGGTATIVLAVETAARGLGRSLSRLRADFDQRLISPTDGYFRNAAFAHEKALYWGGKIPSLAGGAVSPPTGNFGS